MQLDIEYNVLGFNNEPAEKIFGLFNRLHSKSTYEGTDLGLATCRKVAENHGGTIYAHSVPGEGSIFTLILPADA